MATTRITITPTDYENADENDAQDFDILSIMEELELPIDIEPVWDPDEGMARFDVTLASGSFVGLWPAENTPEGIAGALADEFQRLAAAIREAIQDKQASVA